MAKVRELNESGRVGYLRHCPGCDCQHYIPTQREEGPTWGYNLNSERPTFSPSINISWPGVKENGQEKRCHYFLRDGYIQYLEDCSHDLKGITLELPDYPDPEKQ